jgi:hypothetical protein
MITRHRDRVMILLDPGGEEFGSPPFDFIGSPLLRQQALGRVVLLPIMPAYLRIIHSRMFFFLDSEQDGTYYPDY